METIKQTNEHVQIKVEHFSGLKLIKIERSPSPIIILPSLSSVQNANSQTGNRLKVARQGVQSWQLNNSHVNRRSAQQKVLTALKSAGARRGQFALFASTIGGTHHRNKNVKTPGKSTVMSPMTSRSSAAANNANTSTTQNGNETPTRYVMFFTISFDFYLLYFFEIFRF